MHVVINATILNLKQMTGLGVYAAHLIPLLIENLKDDPRVTRITLLGSPDKLDRYFAEFNNLDEVEISEIRTIEPLWRALALNRRIKALKSEKETLLFYSPNHHGVSVQGIHQILTIHDLFAMRFPKSYKLQHYYFKYYLPRILSCSTAIIADSQSSANDLQHYYDKPPPAIVAPLALRNDLDEESTAVLESVADDQFFLFVGAAYPYKNAPRVVEAFSEYCNKSGDEKTKLVFAGGRKEYLAVLRKIVEEEYPAISSRVRIEGYVSTGQLIWLYSNSIALVMTTLYEGFGLPALEAMRYGCPVIASNVGSLPEVCEQAALYVDPCNVTEVADAMSLLSKNEELRDDLARKGHQQVQKFSWEKTVEIVWSVFDDLMKQNLTK